jgi:uncharacterized UPF0160 family protein
MPRTLQENIEEIKAARDHAVHGTFIEVIDEIANNESESPFARIHAIKEVVKTFNARNEEEEEEE